MKYNTRELAGLCKLFPLSFFQGGTFWRYETQRSAMRYDTQGSKKTELLSLVQLASLTIIHRIKRMTILSLPLPCTIKHYLMENCSSLPDHFIPTPSDTELLNFYVHRDELKFLCDVPLPLEIYAILRTKCSSFNYLSDRSLYHFIGSQLMSPTKKKFIIFVQTVLGQTSKIAAFV
ncbi:hypothetical protein NPIL_688131 [Nephila pilipes]|uniref:Uncharacterized protein n=1 Tax=Nephila pilipes TaxID=299642 RepID=A0A8X6I369_NEPPI|nr:hypothetical protein NPIL_105801 [Nephila pilipes]GFU02926.1 hypothetical protein NPIL_688131 [Nephila pilipes]